MIIYGSMVADYHVHTSASQDAMGEMEDFIKIADQRKMDEIGFSEHIILHHINNYPRMPVALLPNYVERISEARRRSKVSVKLGAEVEFFPYEIDAVKEFTKGFPFDYVMGSAHFVGNWSVYSLRNEYPKRDIYQAYKEYFEVIRELAGSRAFDVIAHPDIIKIFGFKPNNDISDILSETAGEMGKHGICLEINTGGLRKPCKEIYPSKQFLQASYDNGVPITFGSDAHKPEELGMDLDKAVRLAKEVGYKQFCKFNKRERVLVEF